jgi:predicted membrane GTPase involved in stress response
MVDTPGHADFGGEVCGPHIIFYVLNQNVDSDVIYNMIITKFVAG